MDDSAGAAGRVIFVVGCDEADHPIVHEDAADVAMLRVAPSESEELGASGGLAAANVDEEQQPLKEYVSALDVLLDRHRVPGQRFLIQKEALSQGTIIADPVQ